MCEVEKALEYWHGIEFYERADVSKTKKVKFCNVCDQSIPVGSSHLGYRFYGNDGDWPVFIVCNECEKNILQTCILLENLKNQRNSFKICISFLSFYFLNLNYEL